MNWFSYGGASPCSTPDAVTATLKSTRSGRRSQCRLASVGGCKSYFDTRIWNHMIRIASFDWSLLWFIVFVYRLDVNSLNIKLFLKLFNLFHCWLLVAAINK